MPGSRLRYRLHEAIGKPGDWSLSWSLADDVTFGTCCGFCGQERQRVTYEVERDAQSLWICQRCVGRYDLGGAIDGVRLNPQAIRAQLHGLTARLKQQTCRDVISQCLGATDDPTILEVALHFDRNLQLSPSYAASLFSVMMTLPKPIDRRIFEIQTRSKAHQSEFGELDHASRSLVWLALTPQQQRRLTGLGFAPRMRARIAANRSSNGQISVTI